MAVTRVALTGTFRHNATNGSTTAAVGRITVTPNTRVLDTAGDVLLEPKPYTVTLDSNGTMGAGISVVASNSADILPTSGLIYVIEERIDGAGVKRWKLAPTIADSPTLDITAASPLGTVPPIVIPSGNITDHLNDTLDAHDAGAVSVVPTGGIAATTVQAALAELDTEKQASIPPGTYVQVVNLAAYGADPTGVIDSHAALVAFSAALNAAPGATGFIPAGTYLDIAGGGLTVTAADVTVVFAGGASISNRAGFGVVWNGARGVLYDPRVRFDAGAAPAGGIQVAAVGGNTASRTKLYNPQVISNINVPANVHCIDVYDNCTWVEVFAPKVRKASGALTGQFASGVRFRKICNAGRVWGGDLSDCDDRVQIDGSNNVVTIGVAYEGSLGYGVRVVEPTEGGNGHGGAAAFCRFEMAGATCIALDQTTAFSVPFNIGPNYVGGGTYLSNPNAQLVRNNMPGGLRFLTDDTKIQFRSSDTWFVIEDYASGGMISAQQHVRVRADSDVNGVGTVTVEVGNTTLLTANANGIALGSGSTPQTGTVISIAAGLGIRWGTDAQFGRLAADIVGTSAGDKLVANAGLGVGNSAAASTPGTVVRKMQVFDAAGASLGYVPIYDAIT